MSRKHRNYPEPSPSLAGSVLANGPPLAGALEAQLEAGAAAIAASGQDAPIENSIGDLAVRVARAGGRPGHVAIPADRVDLSRDLGLNVEYLLEPVKVRELRLRSDAPFAAGNIVARSKDGVTTAIQFEPWQRHHRVREIEDETGRVRAEYCVPESWCMYVPLAEG